MATVAHRTVADTRDICLEIVGGSALCRQCSIDPQGSKMSIDYRSFSSKDPGEISAHVLKHISLRQPIDPELSTLEFWQQELRRKD